MLLSHARKVIDAALPIEIRMVYQFDLCQLGLRNGTETSTAIIRQVYKAPSTPVKPILDLSSAYDTMSGYHPMTVLRAKLPHSVVSM